MFTFSAIKMLNLDETRACLRKLPRPVTSGWQLLNITTVLTGSPFTVFSGVQQTGVGAGGADRPDTGGKAPVLNQSRGAEDYFRARRRQSFLLWHSHQRSRGDRTEPGPVWNLGP